MSDTPTPAPMGAIELPAMPDFLVTDLCASMQEWAEAEAGDAAEEVFEFVVRRFGYELQRYAREAVIADRTANVRAALAGGQDASPDVAKMDEERELTQAAWNEGFMQGGRFSKAMLEPVVTALQKLVALKDEKDQLQRLHNMGHGTDYTHYHREQPLAWESARNALDALGASATQARAAESEPAPSEFDPSLGKASEAKGEPQTSLTAPAEAPLQVPNALTALRSEALEVFDGPETPQDVRDVIEWYSSSIGVILNGARLKVDLAIQGAATPTAAAGEREPDMRAVCDALGFDPTNHHNAAKCPYCRPTLKAAAPLPVAQQAHPDCPNAFVCAGRCSGDRCADAMSIPAPKSDASSGRVDQLGGQST